MAKKYYKLEYLESFVGKDYIATTGQFHMRIVDVGHSRFASNTFNTQLKTYTVYTHQPLKNEFTGHINVEHLLDKNRWLEKTPAVQVLYMHK